MFARWGRAVVRLRWVVLAAALVLVAVGVTWGAGVFGALVGGGFDDPASESTRARERINQELGNQDADLLVLYSSTSATVDEPAFREPVAATLAALRQRPEVASVVSYYDTAAPDLVSADRHATYAVFRLRAAGEDAKTEVYERLVPALRAPGVRTEAGGNVPFLQQANEQTSKDIERAETLSMPVLLVLLVVVFSGLVAAATPLLIGGLTILGGFIATRLLTTVTDVSIFAINIITLIGLGMAIDYSLFVVSRFREELAAGHEVPRAVERTMATAGRTVAVSGLTITLALASLLIFPQVFLRSMGLGGMAAVLVAMIAALTVLPALLAVLGTRINALRVRRPWRRRPAVPQASPCRAGDQPLAGRPVPRPRSNAASQPSPREAALQLPSGGAAPRPAGVADLYPGPSTGSALDGAWARIARSVMRRPVSYLVGVVAVLLVLAAPFLRIQWGGFDERVLPADLSARVVAERIRTEFPSGSVAPVDVLVSGAGAAQARQFTDRIGQLPRVTGVRVTASRGSSTLVAVTYAGEPTGDDARAVVRAVRDLPPPPGVEVLVGGRTAADVDLLHSLGARLPWMALIMASATLVLLFLAFGSVLLPIKAVLMNLISIGASFGVVVWVFQEGHFAAALGFTATGFIEPTNPILMLAVLFGLATDYEVFLLSRVREEWDRTRDNTTSVSAGLQHTGRIITAAALLLMIVVAGFATGGIAFVKLIGVGIVVALAVDATLVRALLVPATMRLLGRWNWWAPGPLASVYRRYGIGETGGARPAGTSGDERAEMATDEPGGKSGGSVAPRQHRRVCEPAEQ